MTDVGTAWLLLYVVGGIYLLVRGADHLVDGASALALHFGIRPLVVGLTIVAFGTSAPELATCLRAVIADAPAHALTGAHGPAQFALGNVVGSNVCNIALVLGLAALLAPIGVERSLLRREIPFLCLLSLTFALLVHFNALGLGAGLLLLAAFLAFIAWTGRETLRQRREAVESRRAAAEDLEVDVQGLELMEGWSALGAVLLGLVVLTAGAELLVQSAGALARQLAISDQLIGLTIVALGTSLPELATTLAAARKGSLELALGNVVGSNIFNIGLVVGLPTVLYGWPVDGLAIRFDLVVMLLFTALLAGAALRSKRLSRRTGAILLGGYGLYLAALLVTTLASR